MKREPAVAGQFYSATCQEVESYIEKFNRDLEAKGGAVSVPNPRVIIVPHAGYIYSGYSANIAHRSLAQSKAKRVVVIGPSHRIYIQGASISLHQEYVTPCGELLMDRDYALKLQKQFGLIFDDQAHDEHSTETQMPFIKHYLPQAKVCEIVYSQMEFSVLADIVDEILKDDTNVVVISTDLSHFYSLEEANRLDEHCIEGIKNRDNSQLSLCEACGKIGLMATLEVAKRRDLKTRLLDYKTSADTNHDKSRVVGYLSALIG